jgi:hypothetical protein
MPGRSRRPRLVKNVLPALRISWPTKRRPAAAEQRHGLRAGWADLDGLGSIERFAREMVAFPVHVV